jgi:hypothetical protein
MGKKLVATYDPGGLYVKDAMLLLNKSPLSIKYLLGIINSRLLNYYYQEFFVTIDVLKNALLSLPIFLINLNNSNDRLKHDKMVNLVDKILYLYSKRQSATSHTKISQLDKMINLVDEQIDEMVYLLYGVKGAEKKVVEAHFN